MKNIAKILVVILSLVMVLSMVACNPTDQPGESTPTPGASSTPSAGGSSSTPPSGNTGNSKPEEVDINTVINDFITGATFLDGKIVAENGGNGNEKWAGTALEGYTLMSTNYKKADSKAQIEFNIAVNEDSLITFDVKVDADDGDVFYAAIDGRKAPIGDLGAGEYAVALLLSEGEHTVRLVYAKDSSGNDGTDTVYVSKAEVVALTALIDGEMDEVYTLEGTKKNVKVPRETNQPAGYNGLGATAYIVNDAAGLYIYAEILDKSIKADTDGDVDNEDVFKVYLDYARSFEETGLFGYEYRADEGKKGTLGLGWVGVTPDGKVGANFGFSGVEIVGAAKEIEGGYAVEMFIPLATAKIVDGTIGIGFQCVNDTNACFYSGSGDFWYQAYETLPTYTLK